MTQPSFNFCYNSPKFSGSAASCFVAALSQSIEEYNSSISLKRNVTNIVRSKLSLWAYLRFMGMIPTTGRNVEVNRSEFRRQGQLNKAVGQETIIGHRRKSQGPKEDPMERRGMFTRWCTLRWGKKNLKLNFVQPLTEQTAKVEKLRHGEAMSYVHGRRTSAEEIDQLPSERI